MQSFRDLQFIPASEAKISPITFAKTLLSSPIYFYLISLTAFLVYPQLQVSSFNPPAAFWLFYSWNWSRILVYTDSARPPKQQPSCHREPLKMGQVWIWASDWWFLHISVPLTALYITTRPEDFYSGRIFTSHWIMRQQAGTYYTAASVSCKISYIVYLSMTGKTETNR